MTELITSVKGWAWGSPMPVPLLLSFFGVQYHTGVF
jgi:hypothetical protein